MKKGVWASLPVGFLLVLVLVPLVFAQTSDAVIINSKNWQDVYSGVLYSKLIQQPHNFLVSERHALIYLQILSTDLPDRLLVESDQPYYTGFGQALEDEGFNIENLRSANNNLALAQRVVTERAISSFIIVDDAYGYNAISVTPYAVLTNSYVLFANSLNINDVLSFLNGVDTQKVMIVGRVDRAVRTALEGFNPEIVQGDSRFEINVEMMKRYMAIKPMSQTIITNGEFIEEQVMTGAEPVLFVGKNNIPSITRDYVQSTDLATAVLIGNDLIQTATQIKRELGVTTFVKFARTARIPTGSFSQVEGLDLFYLPQYVVAMTIESVQYNELTKQLEVTYRNLEDLAVYFRSSLSVNDGISTVTVGDEDATFMDRTQTRTIAYDYEPVGDTINATALVLYGESATSLEKALEGVFNVGLVRILDSSDLELKSIFYSKKDNAFGITVHNPSAIDVYANAEVREILIGGYKTTIGGTRITRIAPGADAILYVRAELVNLDLLDNPEVQIRVYHGQRQEALIKSIDGTLELEVKGFEYAMELAVAIGIVIILALLLWFVLAKRRKKKKRH